MRIEVNFRIKMLILNHGAKFTVVKTEDGKPERTFIEMKTMTTLFIMLTQGHPK